MNMLAPDVVAIGNHETDYGIAHLLFLEKCAKFPIINSNLHIRTNNSRLFKPYNIIEIDGMRILFIGILTKDIVNQTRNEGLHIVYDRDAHAFSEFDFFGTPVENDRIYRVGPILSLQELRNCLCCS